MQLNAMFLLLAAIAQVESGPDDHAVGRHGEVSRYQILPKVWRAHSASREYSNPVVARNVALIHLRWLSETFRESTGRDASPLELAILWQQGFRGFQCKNFDVRKLSASARDRAERCINLYERNDYDMEAHLTNKK